MTPLHPSRSRPSLRWRFQRFSASGRLTPLLLGLLTAIILLISYERGKGNYHRLQQRLLAERAASPPESDGPGGEAPLILRREPDAVGKSPEFVSATFLPGRGMSLLQLTAHIPGHGEVPLLLAPSLNDATRLLSGTGPDTNGALSSTMGAAFLVPWAGVAIGKPTSTPGFLQASFAGAHLTFPAGPDGNLTSTEGLLLNRAADGTRSDTTLDGQSAEATFHPGSFSGNWPSTANVTIRAEMRGYTLDLAVTVLNTGFTSMPAAVGWKPFFRIPSQDRADASLTLSATDRLLTDRSTGLPSGKLEPLANTPLDFNRARGTRLGTAALDDTFVHLVTPILASSPLAEVRDTNWGFGMRILPLTSNIRAIRVLAPASQSWISIGPDMNTGDVFGSQWTPENPSGMQVLKPGEALTWKVRLELFTLATEGAAMASPSHSTP